MNFISDCRKDKPTDIEGADNKNDCSETWGQQWAIQESCLQQIEKVLRWTASQNLWAVLTVRASLAAGRSSAFIRSSCWKRATSMNCSSHP